MFTEGPKYELVMQTQCLEVVCLVKTITVRMPAMLRVALCAARALFGDVNLSRLLSTNCTAIRRAELSTFEIGEGIIIKRLCAVWHSG